MFKLNLKIALRNLWKNKGFTLINIGGLAIGLACCLMLMLYVYYEWSYDKEIKNGENVYVGKLNLMFNGKLATTSAVPYKYAAAIKEEIPAIKRVARMSFEHANKLFSYKENNFKINAHFVDPDMIKIIKYDFINGSASHALDDPNSIIITKTTAEKLFGKENPVGKQIKWDRSKILTVTGVIADLPKNQSIQFEALQSWKMLEQLNPDIKNAGWGSIDCTTIVELKDNKQLEATNALLKDFIVAKEKDLKPYVYQTFLYPLSSTHLYGEFVNGKPAGGAIVEVRLFAFLAICVLFIACINYMNLSTARSEKRAREVGVRKALGSARGTLMGQFIIESILMSFIAMLIAFALLEFALPYFNNLLDINIEINYTAYGFWSVLLVLVLVTGFLAGSYPAFYLSSFIPVKVLKGFKGTAGSLSIRRVLVVVQFSLSICMIICAVFVYNQIQYLKNKPLGFDQNGIAQLDLEGELKNPSKLQVLTAKLKEAGVIVAATEFAGPFTDNGSITGDISWPGKSADDKSIVNYRSTGFDFTKTIGAKIIAGRDFSPTFSADTSTSLLLNESAVKMMNLKNPVGTVLHWGDNPPLRVIGVVQDYFNESIGTAVKPTLYYYNVKSSNVLLLKLNTAQSLTTAIEKIKKISAEINPGYPSELKFVSDGMKEKLRSERLLSVLSNFFGGFAIFISCLGLLGLALYMAEQRNKEISIRKVLGANISDILVLLNKDFLKLVVVSNLIAMPLAYILVAKWLQKYDYKTAINFWPFLLAVLLSLVIAILTVSLQTFKVAKANAVDALKYE
jgi:putative ABC transport system permease protein